MELDDGAGSGAGNPLLLSAGNSYWRIEVYGDHLAVSVHTPQLPDIEAIALARALSEGVRRRAEDQQAKAMAMLPRFNLIPGRVAAKPAEPSAQRDGTGSHGVPLLGDCQLCKEGMPGGGA